MVVLWSKFNKIVRDFFNYSTFETTKFEVEFSSRSIPGSRLQSQTMVAFQDLYLNLILLVFLWPLKEKKADSNAGQKKKLT